MHMVTHSFDDWQGEEQKRRFSKRYNIAIILVNVIVSNATTEYVRVEHGDRDEKDSARESLEIAS